MMRRVSFQHTQAQMRIGAAAARASADGYAGFVEGGKDITRRTGWHWAKRGMLLLAVSKCMGLRPGERAEIFGVIEVLETNRERLLDGIEARDFDHRAHRKGLSDAPALRHHNDREREGFPDLSARSFAQMFCAHMGTRSQEIVTRVVFRHVDARRHDAVLLALTGAQVHELDVRREFLAAHKRRVVA